MLRNLPRFFLWMFVACIALVNAPAHLHAQPAAKPDGAAPEAKEIFSTTCVACHGLDGAGGEHGPDIAHRREVQRLGDRALMQIVRDGVPGTGMPAFSSLSNAQVEAVVHYLRELQGQTLAVKLPGDPKKGRILFTGAPGCSQCHMTEGEGGVVGPDLSSYAATLSVADIRSAITEPNRGLDPRKRMVIVTTKEGKTLAGIARNEDNFSLQLQTTDGHLHLFARSDLQSIEYQPRSLMPGDYATRLSRQELDDLISYLISAARNKKKPEADQDED
ncbi:MAG: c-type cytochrome [Terriglobales bacterium]